MSQIDDFIFNNTYSEYANEKDEILILPEDDNNYNDQNNINNSQNNINNNDIQLLFNDPEQESKFKFDYPITDFGMDPNKCIGDNVLNNIYDYKNNYTDYDTNNYDYLYKNSKSYRDNADGNILNNTVEIVNSNNNNNTNNSLLNATFKDFLINIKNTFFDIINLRLFFNRDQINGYTYIIVLILLCVTIYSILYTLKENIFSIIL